MVTGVVRCAREAGARVWDVVIGARFIVALEAPAPEPAVMALAAAALDSAAGLEGLVGRIPLGAIGVGSFGLVWWPPEGGPLTVVVRGGAAVDVASPGGRRRLDSKGITPWHLAEFREVTAVRIGDAGSSLDALGAGGFPVAPGSGVVRATSVEWRAADPGSQPPLPTAPGDHELAGLERTRLVPQSEPDGWAAAGAAGASGASDSAGQAQARAPLPRFRIGTGDPIEVDGVVRVGRSPQGPTATTEPVRLVSVGREAGEVSATHLELRREGSRLVATDLRSTNGTLVRTPAGARRMRTGESIVVMPGAVLDLGSDTIIEILPPHEDRALPKRQAPA